MHIERKDFHSGLKSACAGFRGLNDLAIRPAAKIAGVSPQVWLDAELRGYATPTTVAKLGAAGVKVDVSRARSPKNNNGRASVLASAAV